MRWRTSSGPWGAAARQPGLARLPRRRPRAPQMGAEPVAFVSARATTSSSASVANLTASPSRTCASSSLLGNAPRLGDFRQFCGRRRRRRGAAGEDEDEAKEEEEGGGEGTRKKSSSGEVEHGSTP